MSLTKLDKPIKRKTVILTDNRTKARGQDEMVVTLYPPSDIAFRTKRGRTEYRLPLSVAYRLAVEAHVKAEKRRKAEEKKLKKSAR